jgi:hypothetical protein
MDHIREDDSMHKEELFHLHMLMFLVKMYFEGITNDKILTERYNSLEISPTHIHKDKNAHRDALLTLGDEIVSHIRNQKLSTVNYSHVTAPPEVAGQN